MASYGYGYTKVIKTNQGNMPLADITSGRMYVNIPPANTYAIPAVDWWVDNGYVYYAHDIPSPMATPPASLFEVAKIGATSIYACLYVNNPDILPIVPPTPLMGENVRIACFNGDANGEQTESNPNGYRLINMYTFPLWERIEQHTIIGIDETVSVAWTTKDVNYWFFNVLDSANEVYMTCAPLNVDPTRVDIELSDFAVRYDLYYSTASALTTGTEYIGIGSMQLFALNGEPITADELDEDVGDSGTGGGDGTFDTSTDSIGIPALPTLGAANSGLITLYNPTIGELRQLSNWLWSSNLLDVLERMYAQPMDLIVSLNIVPCEPSQLGSSQAVKVGGVDTNINMTKVLNQYSQIDCGTVNVREYFGSALDYGQYTKVSIYLPFINTVTLKVDEIMGANIHVVYNVDLFSGSCTAFVEIIRSGINNVLYSFEGNLAVNLPLISRDFSNVYTGIVKTGVNSLTSGFNPTAMLDSAISVMSTKPNINRTGGVSSMGGLLGVKKPYFIIERPIQSLADGYKDYVGYPSNITAYLYTLKGYTEVEEVICDTLKCTKEEQDAIVARLKSGVIL